LAALNELPTHYWVFIATSLVVAASPPMSLMVFMLGDKLLDRLRSATFAMLGLVTAVGLVLVALVLQQGWPSVFGGPLPGFPNKPPADEIASAVPGSSGGGAALTPQFGVGVAPLRAGSVSDGNGFNGSRGQQGSDQVAASAPVTSSPGPAPSETAPESQTAPPPVNTSPSPAPAPPTAVAPPAAQAAPAASTKESDGSENKAAAGAESKKTRGKDKVAANGKGSSSKGTTTTATAKPKSSRSKSKPSSAKPSSPPVEKASAEPAPSKPVPPVYEPDKNENETLPVEEKGESGPGHGSGKDK
jgi:hypothetical protein